MDITQVLLQLAQTNAQHISTLNGEMGQVMADVAMIKWFITLNIGIWIAGIAGLLIPKLFKK